MSLTKVTSIIACLVLWASPILAQDAPPVDIYQMSMEAYVNMADSNMTMKVYSATYCEALEKEADRLAQMVIKTTRPSQDLPGTIRKAHAAMKAYAQAIGGASEDVLWWDFDAKEMMQGTGYGYTTKFVQAAIYWRHIIAYQELVQSNENYELDVTSPLTTTKIGGVAPMLLYELVKRPKFSKTTQKRVENHKKLHSKID